PYTSPFRSGGAVADDVAGDDVLLGREARGPRGTHDDVAAGQPLADVVVRVALEPQRDAGGEEGAERLPRRAREGDVDRLRCEARFAVALGDLVAEHRADGALRVADRQLDDDRLAVVERRLREPDELPVEVLLELVILTPAVAARRILGELG